MKNRRETKSVQKTLTSMFRATNTVKNDKGTMEQPSQLTKAKMGDQEAFVGEDALL